MFVSDSFVKGVNMNLRTDLDCPMCSTKKIKTKMEEHKFTYGMGKENAVDLKVTIPVRSCDDCGFEFTDYETDEIIDAAVQVHLQKKGA